jgi:DNA replication protein DnaC
MNASKVRAALRERVEQLAPYLFPNGKRDGAHWCVADISGRPGKSFRICVTGEKAGLWGDFADSREHSKNLLNLWMEARNLDFKTALREAAKWTGQSLNGSEPPKQNPPQNANEHKPKPINWQECVDAFSAKHLEWLSDSRGYSGEFCAWLHKRGLVGLHDGCIAFPVHDAQGNVVAAHFRLKNGKWNYAPTGVKTCPLVIGELLPGDTVYVFESQWDAFAFMDASGIRDGIIITRGASNGALVANLIPQAATIYVWPQNDAPGQKWAKDVCAHTKCAVKSAKTPSQFADLNDWTRGGATSDDLLQAMMSAEVVREREKSWDEALAESEVTATELHDLKLTPRKKLLGDWFAEGDGGFIFAFRGTGKTWLAVAMANALATGGKLGDWQAHAPVKVLYIDSEMPPDLMRERCDGLGTASKLRLINHDILFERTGKVLNIANREIQEAITKRCVNTGVKVLFIDNLSTAAFGMRENEADSWELVVPWLLELRRRKIAVVIIHHAGRSGEMRGTSKREDSVFWIIALDDMKKNADDKRGARFVSHFTKPSRNTQEEVPAYEWHFVTEPSGEVTISHRPAQTLDVFRSILEAGVTEPAEIAQEMKVPKYVVSRLAKKAADAGWLAKEKRGGYKLLEVKK